MAHVTDWVVLPHCDREFSEASGLVRSGRFTECDGNAAIYAAEPQEGHNDVEMTFDGPLALPDSGLIRGPWCPGFSSDFEAGSVASEAGRHGGLCLDLS